MKVTASNSFEGLQPYLNLLPTVMVCVNLVCRVGSIIAGIYTGHICDHIARQIKNKDEWAIPFNSRNIIILNDIAVIVIIGLLPLICTLFYNIQLYMLFYGPLDQYNNI